MNEKIPKLATGCRLSGEGEATVLLVPEAMIRLDPIAIQILKLCDGKKTVDDILKILKSEYSQDTHAQIESDTLQFLNKLQTRGVLHLQ